jgi:hypothetical protein
MAMKFAVTALLALPILATSTWASAAPTPRGAAVPIACAGPIATEGRNIAKGDNLKLGQDPRACFGKMQIYEGPNHEFVVTAPASDCPGGQRHDVYSRSNAGTWYSFFEAPVCGSSLSVGPKDPWGDWMLSVDGKHYDSKGAYYVPVTH